MLVGLCFLVPWLAGGALAEAEDRRLGDDTATVRGLVWQDLDEDGQLTQGEPGLAGALLVLADENGAFLAYTHSGAAGEYRFDNLAPGVYLLFENDPASYGSTTPNKVRIALSPGEVATIDFGDGFFLSGCFRNVAGTVWHDADLDNRQEAGEVGLDGLIVRVVDLAGEVQGLTISEQGRYALRNLPAARYHVSFIPLASWPYSLFPIHWAIDLRGCLPAQIDVGFQDQQGPPWVCDGTSSVSQNFFADAPTSSMAGSPPYLAGTVWKRGQRGREPWAGARISLLDAEGAAILQERLSGPKGEYYFGALASGLYRVFQEPLAGYEATPCYWGAVLHEGAELVIDFEHRPLSGQGAESIFLPLLSSS